MKGKNLDHARYKKAPLTDMKGGANYESDIFCSPWLLLSVFALRVRGRGGRATSRAGREALLAGGYQRRSRLFSGKPRQSRPQLYIRCGATGGESRLFGRGPIPHCENYHASAPDFEKALSQHRTRQCRTVIPGPYVVSSRGPKSGTDEYPTRYERELVTGLTT